jgi:curved DNA-binding protein
VPKVKKNYYEVLGVAPFSHARVIEETYWERAHELHGVPTRKAAQRLRVLNEAYEVLASPHKRAEYDRRHRRQQQAEARANAGFFGQVLSVLGKPFRPD